MNKEKLLFLINPISGGRSKSRISDWIQQYLDHQQYEAQIVFTEYAGHAEEILRSRMEEVETVVAVGGDGTINEIARVLSGTSKVMTIIPQGSGNGLARHLGISLKPHQAIRQLNHSKSIKLDTLELNGHFFVSIAGVGFDSLIAQKFVSSTSRGFFGYASLVLSEYFKFKENQYQLNIDGKTYNRQAALISFANSNQFGYNTIIAPHADLTDGFMEVCILRKPRWYQIPSVLIKVWTGKADQSSLLEIIPAKSVSLYPNTLQFANIDGESVKVGEKVEVNLHPAQLNFKIPKNG